MRFKTFILFLITSTCLFAQENNSLLWKITGNNLSKPSYLYGTMHVSDKIAFRLDDVFYEALNNAEYVALESDPNLWLDYYIENENAIDFNNSFKSGFYKKAFAITQPKPQAMASVLGFNGQMLNKILYRTNTVSQNFEEETYLDMFIYQACKKFNKKFVALEDIEESSYMVERSQLNMNKEEPDSWLSKKLQKESYYNLLQNAYRERNIFFIDSLNKAMYTDNHLKYMLYERNRIMAKGIDATAQKGSVFIGIGAAHLAGEEGVIALLRDYGYTVTPLTSNKTKTATTLKEHFENTFTINKYSRDTISDGLFSIELPNKLYHFISLSGISLYASPDLTNGAFFSVTRVSTFPYLKEGDVFTFETLEDMYFESIPGKIISKKTITNGPYQGVDIVNQLKNGDYQRYQIFKTPLEIITLKLGGKKDFTQQYSDRIFNSLVFRDPNSTTNWTTVTNSEQSFALQLPQEHVFYNVERSGNRMLQGYRKDTDSYFLVERNTLNDIEYIEEDGFELKYIQKQFYENLEFEPKYNTIQHNNGLPTLTSSAVIDSVAGKKLFVKTTLHEADYYLMAAFTTSEKEANTFFNSLQITTPKYSEKFEQVIDTSLYFSTLSNVKMPPADMNSSYQYGNNKKNKKDYLNYTKNTSYANANDEKIEVTLTKLHDYAMYENVDSLWNDIYNFKNYNLKSFIVRKKDRGTDTFKNKYQNLTLRDTLSSRTIEIKSILKNGVVYELKSVGDTLQKPSEFVTKFYNNFSPKDSVIGVSPFEDKTNLFFEKLRANDSVVITGLNQIRFAPKHLDSLIYFVDRYNFPEDKKYIRNSLLRKIINIKSPRVKPYLKKLYKNSYQDSYVQELILNELGDLKSKKAVEDILNLLEIDFPVNVSNYNFFYAFKDSTNISKHFFPKALDYASIEDYKYPIYYLLSRLVLHEKVNPKIYKKDVNQLLNEAKIELKRQLSQENSAYKGDDYYDEDYYTSWLVEYAMLLYPFANQNKVASFLEKIPSVKDEAFNIDYLMVKKLFGEKVTSADFKQYAEDSYTRSYLYNALKTNNLLSLYPKQYFNQDSLTVGAFYVYMDIERNELEYEFIKKKNISNKKGDFTVFVYKVKTKTYQNTDEWKLAAYAINTKAIPTAEIDFYKSVQINNYESLEEQTDVIIDEFELIDRKRAGGNSNRYDYDYDY